MGTPETGLRERKKLKTREAIVNAAMDLFEERGFEGTTVADIAAAADIAPRTFFAYFPSKDDVVFYDFEETLEGLRSRLRDRDPGETAVDAIRAWVAAKVEGGDAHERHQACRRRLIRESEALAAHDRHLFGHFERALGEAVAEDLEAEADDIRVRMVAAAGGAAFRTLAELKESKEELDAAEAMALVDQALIFLRGGLEALRSAPR
jgi:AcrR family transcriptional regulator